MLDLDLLQLTVADKPFALPPPWNTSASELRAYILGRVSRWSEVPLDPFEVSRVCAKLVTELRAQGWGHAQFRHVFFSCRGKPNSVPMFFMRAAIRAAFAF